MITLDEIKKFFKLEENIKLSKNEILDNLENIIIILEELTIEYQKNPKIFSSDEERFYMIIDICRYINSNIICLISGLRIKQISNKFKLIYSFKTCFNKTIEERIKIYSILGHFQFIIRNFDLVNFTNDINSYNDLNKIGLISEKSIYKIQNDFKYNTIPTIAKWCFKQF